MFRLIKILAAGVNQPEPTRIALNTPITAKRGTPILVKNGDATVFTAATASTTAPNYILMREAEGETDILAARLPDGALFAAPLSANAASVPSVGTKITLGNDGTLDPTPASSTAWGPVVYDTCGAKGAGDEILALFPTTV